MEPIVRIRKLVKDFGGPPVLRGIDLDVAPGSILGYIGPNGAGKTTTVKILIGMLGGFSGTVEVCGVDVARDPLAVKRRIGYVPEVAALYDTLTAMEFLELVGTLHGLSRERTISAAARMLGLLGIESEERQQRLATFSKGMRQKVLLTAALVHDPELIVMDEPLSGLDANSAVLVKEVLRLLADQGKTVFYCSHVMDVVERVCDRIVILNGGAVVADGSFEELQEMNRAASLESLFTQLTSRGAHAEAARRFVDAVRETRG